MAARVNPFLPLYWTVVAPAGASLAVISKGAVLMREELPQPLSKATANIKVVIERSRFMFHLQKTERETSVTSKQGQAEFRSGGGALRIEDVPGLRALVLLTHAKKPRKIDHEGCFF